MIHRIERDWYSLLAAFDDGTPKQVGEAREALKDALMTVAPVFSNSPYFLSDDFTLVDCCIAPLLWRLPQLGIKLPRSAKAISKYEARVFKRDAFQASLTEAEREIRESDEF